jgi:hypothetical protein
MFGGKKKPLSRFALGVGIGGMIAFALGAFTANAFFARKQSPIASANTSPLLLEGLISIRFVVRRMSGGGGLSCPISSVNVNGKTCTANGCKPYSPTYPVMVCNFRGSDGSSSGCPPLEQCS